MTATIDKRVVQMAFENDQFEKGTAQSLSTLDRLKKALNFQDSEKSFAGITNAANKVDLGTIANGVSNISNKFSALGILAITTLVNIGNSAYQAGAKIVKSLTIDPITTGLNEYETKLNSVQTILANTQKEGTDLKTVTAALNELNTYSDKTIYNFQQMTRNVGTFTAAGVSLNTSVAAIKGIANLAAISGSNADQASTAMYQLSQALSSGTVKLMDWNSVVNAGMGGQVFQDAIKETARVHGVAIDDMIKTEGSFRETLQKGWFTSEILTETLAKFTGDLNADQLKTMGYTEEQIASIIKMGQTANDAATKVKTFTQLFDTLREAAQSGWAQTWEIVIGDFEEAKAFLTDLNNWMGSIIGASADARNQLLQGWKDLGGRTELIKAFQNALNAIITVINPIRDAMRQIFPPTTAQQLLDLTKAVTAFTSKLILSAESAEKVKRIFAGAFAVVDIVKIAVEALIKNLAKLIGSFSKTGESLVNSAANFGDWLVKLRDSIKQADTFNIFFSNIAKVIKPLIEGVVGFFSSLINGFKDTDKATKSSSVANFLAELSEKFKAFGKVGEIVSKVFNILSKVAEKLGPVVFAIAGKIGNLFNHLLDAITRGLDNLDTNKILDTINKGLTGGVLAALISFVTKSKEVVGGGLFASILLSVKKFIDEGGSVFTGVKSILDGVKTSLEAYQKSLKANSLLKIAAAIGILAVSILALSFIDPNKLLNATAAISAMFFGLMSTLDIFDKTVSGNKQMVVMTGALLGIASAVLILTTSLVILSKLKPEAAAQGVLAIGAVLGTLLLFQKVAGSGVGFVGITAGLVSLSVAMLAVGIAIRNLGNIKPDVLTQGLIAMATALGILAIALNAMTGTIAGAASLAVASAGILVLTIALKGLASLSLEQVGVALLALAGTFTVLGVAAALLTPLAPTLAIIALSLLAIGAAAAAFGLGIAAIGAGLGSLAVGIVTLAGLSSAGIAAISLTITGLAALLPMLAVQVAKSMTSFIVEIAKSAPKIAMAMANLGLEMLKGFATTIPTAVDTVLKFMIKLMDSISTQVPKFVELGFNLLIGFLGGMRNNIGQVVTLSIDIVNTYLKAVASRIPEMVDSGFTLIIAWIDGMKQGVDEHLPELMDSVSELGWAIVNGLLKGLIEGQKNVKDGIVNLANTIINAFKEFLGIHSPSTVFQQLAAYLIEGLRLGIILNAMKVITEIKNLANQVVDGVKGKYSTMLDAGKNLVQGFANGITSFVSTAVNAAASLAKQVLERIKTTLGIHSPSDETTDDGMFLVKGLANGITKFSGIVLKSTEALGDKTLSGFNSIISKVSDAINTNMDFSPSIRPVVDLTAIKNGTSQIDSLLGDKSFGLSLASTTAARISATNNANISPEEIAKTGAQQNISFTQNNYSPKELSRFDIYRQTKNQLLQAKGLVGA